MLEEKLAEKQEVELGINGIWLTEGNTQSSSLVSSLTCIVSVRILVAPPPLFSVYLLIIQV